MAPLTDDPEVVLSLLASALPVVMMLIRAIGRRTHDLNRLCPPGLELEF